MATYIELQTDILKSTDHCSITTIFPRSILAELPQPLTPTLMSTMVQLRIAIQLQPLLQGSEASKSQTNIHPGFWAGFICFTFCLWKLFFFFFLFAVSALWCSMQAHRPTWPGLCHWLERTPRAFTQNFYFGAKKQNNFNSTFNVSLFFFLTVSNIWM